MIWAEKRYVELDSGKSGWSYIAESLSGKYRIELVNGSRVISARDTIGRSRAW